MVKCFVCGTSIILCFFFFSSRRRHTRCALVTGVQTCALPIFPRDSVARAVGADKVAVALVSEAERRQLPLELRRTSSRGLYWLEPMLELETADGRLGFGPITPQDVPSLLDALAGDPASHP